MAFTWRAVPLCCRGQLWVWCSIHLPETSAAYSLIAPLQREHFYSFLFPEVPNSNTSPIFSHFSARGKWALFSVRGSHFTYKAQSSLLATGTLFYSIRGSWLNNCKLQSGAWWVSSVAPTVLRRCTTFRAQAGEEVARVSGVASLYGMSTTGERNLMRKEQVLPENPNKTIYSQLGTLTQTLPSWERLMKKCDLVFCGA